MIGGDLRAQTERWIAGDPDDPLSHKAAVEAESVRVLRRRGDLIMTETRHGFVCANAGVDLSNVAQGTAALLPDDPDRSARGIRADAGVAGSGPGRRTAEIPPLIGKVVRLEPLEHQTFHGMGAA